MENLSTASSCVTMQIDAELAEMLHRLNREGIEAKKLLLLGYEFCMNSRHILPTDPATQKTLDEAEIKMREMQSKIASMQTKLEMREAKSTERYIKQVAESVVLAHLKQEYAAKHESVAKQYDSILKGREDVEKIRESTQVVRMTGELVFLKESLATKIDKCSETLNTLCTSLSPLYRKSAGTTEKGQLGEHMSIQWIRECYPDAIIEDTHGLEGYGDLHVIFPNNIKIMIEAKNVRSSQKIRDHGKFLKNAQTLFAKGIIHAAIYQSHNNEDRQQFHGMQHNPGITYLDKDKKLMVGVVIGSACTRQASTFLMNVLLDHSQRVLQDRKPELSKALDGERSNEEVLRKLLSHLQECLKASELRRDFYRNIIEKYTDRLNECVREIEQTRIILYTHQQSSCMNSSRSRSRSSSSSSNIGHSRSMEDSELAKNFNDFQSVFVVDTEISTPLFAAKSKKRGHKKTSFEET